MRAHLSAAVAAAAFLSACGSDGGGGDAGGDAGVTDTGSTDNAPFPADYRASYTEVRGCRSSSGDHALNYVRVLADPPSLAPYRDREAPFPEGGVVLKEEFEDFDPTCSGPIKLWSVMIRRPASEATETLGWRWYEVNPDRAITSENLPRCIGCHMACGVPPDGYEGTCMVP